MSYNCEVIHAKLSTLKRYSFPFDEARIPKNGIYILYEVGETGHSSDRIVRIGTHTGDNQLLSRLKQHFVKENKDRSVFRKNIGRCILNKANDDYLTKWEWDLTTRANKEKYGKLVDPAYQAEVEHKVTKYIQENFSFTVIEVLDKVDRLRIESRLISEVSKCNSCRPSNHWLGLSSPKIKIRESGLWLVNELYKETFSKDELQDFLSLIH